MAFLKLNIPGIVLEGSDQYIETLKVCVAALAYDVRPEVCKVPGQRNVSLDLPKEHKSLIDVNAIVRYFSTIGSSPWKSTEHTLLLDNSLIEWEEMTLRQALKGGAEKGLSEAEKIISRGTFEKLQYSIPSPAEIILFSLIHSTTTTTAPSLPDAYPALKEWFLKTAQKPWAKTGVQQAKADESVKAAPVVGSVLPIGPVARKLKEGIAMHVLTEGGKMYLPKPGQKNVLITSALPYVNNVPHLGNIIGSVLSADVFSRYNKARNYNTLYICGTDEYGTATETKALEEKVTPQQLCDKYHVLHRDIYKWFDIGFDYFGRTTTQQQTDISQDIFLKLKANGYLSEDAMTQLYCEKHDGFLADRYVEGTCPRCQYEDARGDQCDKCGNLLDPFDLVNPRCKLDGHSPVARDSRHIFLELDKLQPQINKWVQKSSEEGQWSKNGRIITESWLKEGLKKRCITRDLKWGTPVPLRGYEKKVLYVWFDACIGYVSITANYTKEWERWWRDPENVKLYQFMGKDNVPFHTVIFPGSQLGTGDIWTMLHHISTTEYLQYEYGKFSKSRGVGVFGNNAQDTGIPPSVWRYYLVSSRPETGDTQFVWKDFVTKNNTELLANLGNFVNRVIKFVNAKYNSVVPDYTKMADDPSFKGFREDVDRILAEYIDELESIHLRSGLDKVMTLSGRGNQFLQDNKLDNNTFAKFPEKTAAVIGMALNLIYVLSAVVYPYMPGTAESIVNQLNAPQRTIPDAFEFAILPGHTIGKAAYLFSRIDEKMADEWKARFGGSQSEVQTTPEAKGKRSGIHSKEKEGQNN